MRSKIEPKFLFLGIIVIVTVLAALSFCLAVSVSAQDRKSDIERILRNALLRQSDLPAEVVGWTLKTEDVTSDNFGGGTAKQVWWGHILVKPDPDAQYLPLQKDRFEISIYVNYLDPSRISTNDRNSGYLLSAESFRNELLRRSVNASSKYDRTTTKAYLSLPGGVVQFKRIDPTSKAAELDPPWSIQFWKNPGLSGKTWISSYATPATGYRKSCRQRAMQNDKTSSAECERVANLVWSRLSEAKPAATPKPAEPIVVVVHGIGLGETRSRGWSAWQSECWGITSNMVEITHNPADIADSLEWAKDVKREFDKILIRKKKENRPVMIIAHSCGSVMSKIVLGGGKIIDMDNKTTVFAPMENEWVDVWITLGSPLHSSGRYYYYGKPEVVYGSDKPPQVLYWANFYSTNDSVGIQSSTLKTPDLNSHVEVDDEKRAWLFAKYKLDPDYRKWTHEEITNRVVELPKAQGLDIALAHVAIWYCKPVVSYVRYKYAELKKRAEAIASRSGKAEP